MSKSQKSVAALLLCAFCLSAAGAEKVRIAASFGGHAPLHFEVFDQTRDALEKEFGKENVSFEFMQSKDVLRMASDGELDFYITPGGKSRSLQPKGGMELLTLTTKRFPNPNQSYGGTIWVREDSPIQTLGDLQGKKASANRDISFYGYQTIKSLIASEGYQPDKFFGSVVFPDTNNRDVINLLITGKVDAAMVPSCFVEDSYPENSSERGKLRAIHVMGAEPCLISTPQYPNWVLSTTASTDHELARRVMKTLLALEPGKGKDGRWSVATNFTVADELQEKLHGGIFERFRDLTFENFLIEFREFFFGLAIAFVLIAFYVLSLNWLVRKRTKQLSQALHAQIQLRRQSEEADRRFNALQRAGLIAQMSSMIAHELRQPLSASLAYIHGLQRFVDLGKISKAQIHEILSKLIDQVERAGKIVDDVRSYAKGKSSQMRPESAYEVVNHAVDAFKKSGRYSGEVRYIRGSSAKVLVNPMEIQLAVMNLLRNAADSLNFSHTKNPLIVVKVEESNHFLVVTVEDNGPRLTEENLKKIQMPLSSSKKEGLGLGLSLVKAIVASHGGVIEFIPRRSGGLMARISLPIHAENKNELAAAAD